MRDDFGIFAWDAGRVSLRSWFSLRGPSPRFFSFGISSTTGLESPKKIPPPLSAKYRVDAAYRNCSSPKTVALRFLGDSPPFPEGSHSRPLFPLLSLSFRKQWYSPALIVFPFFFFFPFLEMIPPPPGWFERVSLFSCNDFSFVEVNASLFVGPHGIRSLFTSFFSR